MVATTAAMAVSCGLHDIASAQWKGGDDNGWTYSLLRRPYRYTSLAQSQIDLADRIYALYVLGGLRATEL